MKKIIFLAIPLLVLILLIVFWLDKETHWQIEEGYRWQKLHRPWFGTPGFEEVDTTQTGIAFVNHLEENQIKNNRVLLNGSGVALGDIDHDGLVDIYFCRLSGPNALYKNLGNWTFSNITEQAGVGCPEQFSTASVFADIDGDSDLDLLVTAVGGPNACFLNDGTGKFTNVTESSGIRAETGAASMALADIDGDGDLDVYIANYKKVRAKDIYTPIELGFNNIVQKIGDSYRIAPKFQNHYNLQIRGTRILWFENGEPDVLLLNDGDGKFRLAPLNSFFDEAGKPVDVFKDFGLTVSFRDMDGDLDPDIYVCNDFDTPDRIWINDGKGRFQAISKLAIRKTSNSSMAVDFSDIDRDGDLDFFVVDMLSREHQKRMTQFVATASSVTAVGEIENRPEYVTNTLFLNRGDNTYVEIAHYSGVQASEWSWSVKFVDVDLDGYEDILIPTGNLFDTQDLDTNDKIRDQQRLRMNSRDIVSMYPKLDQPNVAFHNQGNLTFEDVSAKWGFTENDISHGLALGDLDNDGDLDLVVNRLNKPAALLKNRSNAPRIAMRLKGLPPNTQAIGAKIRVLGGPVLQTKEVVAGGTYLSHSDPVYSFATGKADSLTIQITWRTGKTTTLTAKPNRIYEISEPLTAPQISMVIESSQSQNSQAYFEDVSDLIHHYHHEDSFNDLQYQPLLPKRLSQLGPGVSWFDIDNDGDDDLVLPSGKGGELAIYVNHLEKGFTKMQNQALTTNENDQTSVLGWFPGSNQPTLFVGYSNLENTVADSSFILQYDFKNGELVFTPNKINFGISIPGPMAMADTDQDGDLDFFVGGRSIPFRYPMPASSILFKHDNGRLLRDKQNSSIFEKIGLVSGAVFSDLNGDSQPELILAVEWGPIMVFRNRDGVYENATEEMGLANYLGWWQGVSTGDLDEDGDMDIIATNWGLNNKYQGRYTSEFPLHLFYEDFDNNGILDLVEAYHDGKSPTLLPERNLLTMLNAMPHLVMRVPNHSKYSRSTVSEIMGPKLKRATEVTANILSHMVFFNRGDRFEAVPLPPEAQFSPAFHVGVADFNGDGHEDVFISQNFFALPDEIPRQDGGRGLWLQGDGTGKLYAVPGQVSGIKVYGEQRGAALSDFNKDGRIDLVVTQNAAETKLFRNSLAEPGLRIKLQGPKGNPNGIGAALRVIYDNSYGPLREIQAGSGYWSQNSSTQVMGLRSDPKGIWVHWPDGSVSETELTDKQKFVVIPFSQPNN